MDVAEELVRLIGTRLNALGLNPVKGIIWQTAPEDDPKVGELLHGTAIYPFVSISHVTPEQPNTDVSTNTSMWITRTFTVAIVANKAIVQPDPGAYSNYRDKAMRSLHTYRWTGQLTAIANASIFQATIRPSSPVLQGAWQQNNKFISPFDVMIQTEEPTGILS